MKNKILFLLALSGCCYFLLTLNFGCAQISAPTGGPRDSLPPRLVKANPEMNTVNFTGNKVNLTFNEYIDLQDLQTNLIISPLQKNNPIISYNLKSIGIKFRDTLLPNTTYTVNFGDAVRDVHESNVLKNFTYVFSTGSTIDSLMLRGNIKLAESGQADSTIVVMLYRNLSDTAVQKMKPDYIAKPDGKGNFRFDHLSSSDFKIYGLKDGDGGKTYNSKSEIFAFIDSAVNPSRSQQQIILFAYAEQKADNNKPASVLKTAADKKFRYTTNQTDQTFDILQSFELTFNNPLKVFDSTKPALTDTNYNRISNVRLSLDSSRKKLTVNSSLKPSTSYFFIVPNETAQDSAGNFLARTDTIRINTKGINDYGRVLFRFTNLDLGKNPVIIFVQNDIIKYSFPITSTEWTNNQFPPGDYSMRLLYDDNRNGKWDPGNYEKKLQPEKAITLEQQISIRADWDNERDIKL